MLVLFERINNKAKEISDEALLNLIKLLSSRSDYSDNEFNSLITSEIKKTLKNLHLENIKIPIETERCLREADNCLKVLIANAIFQSWEIRSGKEGENNRACFSNQREVLVERLKQVLKFKI